MADINDTIHVDNPRAVRLLIGALGRKGIGLSCTLLMFGGGSHCFIKGWLLNSAPTLGFALAWGAVTLLPWLVAWEANKFVLRRFSNRTQQAWAIAAVMLLSLVYTGFTEWLLFAPLHMGAAAIAGLHTLQHLPEIGIVGLLTIISAFATTNRRAPNIAKGEAPSYSDQVIWARAAGNYVEFKIGQTVKVERMTLRQVEMTFDPARFARINRFLVINRSRVVGSPRGSWIRMSDGTEYRIGDAYRESLR